MNSEIYYLHVIIGVCSCCRKRLGKIGPEVPTGGVKEVSVEMYAMSLVT